MSKQYGFNSRTRFPANEDSVPKNGLAARWGSHNIFEEGFVGVPSAFMQHYTRLRLSNSEAMFILQLMSFKWNEHAPFPSYKTLAERMSITTEMARRHAKSLEDKQLLVRVKRIGQSNAFDLRPLTQALEELLQLSQAAKVT